MRIFMQNIVTLQLLLKNILQVSKALETEEISSKIEFIL